MQAIIDLRHYKEQDKLNQKREVYIELVESMSIFINGRVNVENRKEYERRFLKAYDKSWLWASDTVLRVLSEYMQFKLDHVNNNDVNEEKRLFIKCILEMRKDIGFENTDMNFSDYKFINF